MVVTRDHHRQLEITNAANSQTLDTLARDVRTLKRQVRRLTALLQDDATKPAGPPAAARRDFLPVPKRSFSDVVMTVPQAAAALGLGEEQVRRLLRAEKLAGIPLGGRAGWQVSREAVMEMVVARQTFPSRPASRTATAARTVRRKRP